MAATTESDVKDAMRRVAAALAANRDHLTELDQALGDGDLGITAGKVAKALAAYADEDADGDLGTYLAGGGMAVNRAASSTMGTLLATALMRAGKEARGEAELTPERLAAMLHASEQGIADRGKAKLGDKTIRDALHPAAEAFGAAVAEGTSTRDAGAAALAAAREGRDAVTPNQSRIGRAGWVGERTKGKVDPGCELLVVVLEALMEEESA